MFQGVAVGSVSVGEDGLTVWAENKTNWEEEVMREFQYVIKDAEGIHARPAGELIKLVKTFSSNISMCKDGTSVSCKKILAVMGLGVKQGQEITITMEGEDEDAAYEAISRFLEENL